MSESITADGIAPPPAPEPTRGRWDDTYPVLAEMPTIGEVAIKGQTAKVIREYVRAVMIDAVVKRNFGIGMGIVKIKTPFVVGNNVQLIECEARDSVQQRALSELIRVALPTKQEGEAAPFRGVIVLGEAGMVEARRRNEVDRLAATGPPKQIAEYTPPAGFNVTIIEDDLTGQQVPASPDDAPPPPSSAAPVTSKARELAAKRRSRSRK